MKMFLFGINPQTHKKDFLPNKSSLAAERLSAFKIIDNLFFFLVCFISFLSTDKWQYETVNYLISWHFTSVVGDWIWQLHSNSKQVQITRLRSEASSYTRPLSWQCPKPHSHRMLSKRNCSVALWITLTESYLPRQLQNEVIIPHMSLMRQGSVLRQTSWCAIHPCKIIAAALSATPWRI